MKSLKHYFFIIAISALPFVSLFLNPLAPHTHDVVAHLPRIAAYYKAISGGQILPRWAADLNYGYGMPLFNFIYHVPYLVTSIPIAFGSTLVFAYKFAMLVSFLLSGVFMYMFAERFFKERKVALVVTMLYQFAPFHLLDLSVRGDMAEGYATAFLPLVLYTLVRGFESTHTSKHSIYTGIATSLLILSHNSISLLYFGISALFVLFFAPNNTKRITSFFGLIMGLLLSAFYWVPALLERKFTYGDLFMKDLYTSHFVPLLKFFIPNITDAPSLQVKGVSVWFGLMPTLAFLMGIVVILKKSPISHISRRVVWFSLVLTVASVLMMLPLSRFLWERIALLRMFQFPWRFLNVTAFTLALLGGVTLVNKKTSTAVIAGIIVVTVASVIVYFRPPLGFDYKDEQSFWNYELNTTFFGETDVIWSAGPASSFPKERFQVIGGDGTVTNPKRTDTLHTFTVNAKTDVHVVDNTQYFPGWRVYSDGNKIPIEFQDINWRGLITFRLPSGTHNVRVVWEESPVRQIAETVTFLSIIGSICLLFIRFGNRKSRV